MAAMEYSEDNRRWHGFMMFHVSRLALLHSWQDSKMSTKINFATADRFFFDLVSIFRTYAMIWSDTKMKRWSRFLCLRVRRLSKKDNWNRRKRAENILPYPHTFLPNGPLRNSTVNNIHFRIIEYKDTAPRCIQIICKSPNHWRRFTKTNKTITYKSINQLKEPQFGSTSSLFFSKSLPRVILEAIASYSPVFVRIKISASRSGFEFTSTKCLRFSPQCSTMRSITRSCCSNSKERSYSMAFNPAMNSTVAWHKKRIKTKTSLLRHGSPCLCVLKQKTMAYAADWKS